MQVMYYLFSKDTIPSSRNISALCLYKTTC